MKKDAPSGTAKTLAEILQRARQTRILRHGREGILGERGGGNREIEGFTRCAAVTWWVITP